MMSAKARENAAQASGKSFTALNRHQVMHGERSDYGTEINSLKAFSFSVFAGLHIPAVLIRDAASGSGSGAEPTIPALPGPPQAKNQDRECAKRTEEP